MSKSIDKLKKLMQWGEQIGRLHCKFEPLFEHKNFKYLPQDIIEIYQKIGVGTVGTNTDYLVFEINIPEFFLEGEYYGTFETLHKTDHKILNLASDVDGFSLAYNTTNNTFYSSYTYEGLSFVDSLIKYILDNFDYVKIETPSELF